MLLEKMTFGEIQAALAEGRHDVVVPCGAVEQHGRHLPLDVDAVHADRLAQEVAGRLGTALVAPTIRVGVSPHHMAFPGTISLRPETFEAVCSDYCRSLAAHGFRTILCFSAHGGNFAPLAEMEQRLDDLVGPDCRVLVFADLLGLVRVWRSCVEDGGGDPDHVGGHADVAESSVYAHLRPGDVRTDQLARGYRGPVDDAVLERLFTGGIGALSDTGVMGDPHGFSEAIGALCVQRVADVIAGHFTERMALGDT
ncbi:creatinine amidohydrolase [Geodermatophilus bullaregiensis]|uniref:creatininase family protein n=1 Tax=Geodermatophilus bullaregiensis TaxID=1564160 RepID=UPI00195EC670|nr:creatininase family protein [Geodermatophilus bullaregiensis]MBM7809118.1 creatinine amidohydrolase [Geodermatophilus bullaregiensis]